MKKYLFINYYIDAGNTTLGENFKMFFNKEFDFYDFKLLKNKVSLMNKLQSSIYLRKKIQKYNDSKKKIIFNSIGPATLAYGSYDIESSILILDWIRTLKDSYKYKTFKKDLIFFIQKYILNKFGKIFVRTHVIKTHLIKHYGINQNKISLISGPILFDKFKNKPKKILNKKPKVLFIGNDFLRKGGDVILNNQKKLFELFEITIVTNYNIKKSHNYKILKNIPYGSFEHKDLLKKNDIFFFPSNFEPYGMVISEAASSGLCIITTKDTLSAKYFISNNYSGIIAKNPHYALNELVKISKNKKKIFQLIKNIYYETKKKYNFKDLKNNFKKILF